MMKHRNIMSGVMSVVAMLSLALLASCSMVEFTGEPIVSFDDVQSVEKSNTTKVEFNVEWPSNIEAEDVPQYITVVMNRIQNSAAHYVYHLDSMGNVIEEEGDDEGVTDDEGTTDEGTTDEGTTDEGTTDEGTTDEGTTDEGQEGEGQEGEGQEGGEDGEGTTKGDGTTDEGEEGEEEEEVDDGLPLVQNGFYSIAAVAVNNQDDFLMPDIEQFADSLDLSMRDVYVTVPKLTREEKIEQDYIDYNPMYPYIRKVQPFYYVRPSVKTHTEIWTDKGEDIKTVYLKPQPLTRKVSFSVDVEVEDSVFIDRLVGMISGVPSKVQLMTGYVDDDKTSKVPFEMKSDGGKRYRGDINVFGIFPPANDSLFVGPGILTVTIHASAEKDGVRHKNVFYYNINMKKAIEEAEIMIMTEDRSAYRFSDTENTDAEGNYLEIKDFDLVADDGIIRKITKENVITGQGQGFNKWVPVEDNDNEDINPGLHPEV